MKTYSQKKRAVLNGIIGRYLDEIQLDPKRSIRSLVDLGKVASGNRLQNRFVELVQQMLEREDSPYYSMIQNTVTTVDHQRLLDFGINLGWNSLTQGAKLIRKLEPKLHHHIPWSLTLHLAHTPSSLCKEDYLRLVADGTGLGIYCYFLFPADVPSVTLSLELADAYPDCAFCLLLPGSFDAPGRPAVPRNVILGLDGCADRWADRAKQLQEDGLLFFLYRYYKTQSDMEEITSGRWMEQILPQARLATLLVAGSGGPADALFPAVSQYAFRTRMEQDYPTLMLAFYHDALYTDGLISDTPCFVTLLPDGTVSAYQSGREALSGISIRQSPLPTVLRSLPC